MTEVAQAKPRERIIATAAKLFYDHGINPVGVAQICEEAGVSKRTLYKHFETKEDLVAASMTLLGDAWYEASTSSETDTPKARILHAFKMVETAADQPDFYGCIFMNTSIELRGTQAPANEVVREFKAKLYDYFREQASLMGAHNPKLLAQQLIMLYDGCSAWIVMRREFPASTFQTLELLLDSAIKS